MHQITEQQKKLLGERVISHFGGDLTGRRIGVWGLAFKPGTDDIREAPALVLIEQLLAAGATVHACDPQASQHVAARFGASIGLPDSMYAVAEHSDALVLMTEWPQFRSPNFRRLKALMRDHVRFDGRNIWDPAQLRATEFTYYGIGRGEAPWASTSAPS